MNLEQSSTFSSHQLKAEAEIERKRAEAEAEQNKTMEEYVRRNLDYEKFYDANKDFLDKVRDEALLNAINIVNPSSPYYDMNYISGMRHGLSRIESIAKVVKSYKEQLNKGD